jgi:hypothetical protein
VSVVRQLHIYYRHVHVRADRLSRDPNKARPEWFTHETCFRNLLRTLRHDPQAHRVKLTIVYDGSMEDFTTDFVAPYYARQAYGFEVQFIRGGSDLNSFLITVATAQRADRPATDLVYFLENDYLHQPGWLSFVFDLYDSGLKFDYVSLYDHRDKYDSPMYAALTSRLFHAGGRHWRTAPSTCASFILDKATLDACAPVLASGQTDYHFFSTLVGEQGRVLLTPVPGLATHSMNGYLSPAIDWARVAAQAQQPLLT